MSECLWIDGARAAAKYRQDMDAQRCECGAPACEEPIQPLSKCHPDDGLFLGYYDGVVACFCNTCKSPVIAFHIARKDTP